MDWRIDTAEIRRHTDLLAFAARFTELRKWTSTGELAGRCPKCARLGNRNDDKDFHVHPDGWFLCYGCHRKRGDAIEMVRWLGLAHDFLGACAYLGGMAAAPAVRQRQGAGYAGSIVASTALAAAPAPVRAAISPEVFAAPTARSKAAGVTVPGAIAEAIAPAGVGPAAAPAPAAPAFAPPTPAAPVALAGWQASKWQREAQEQLAAAQAALAAPQGEPGRDYLVDRCILRETWEAWGLGYATAWDPRVGARRPAIVIPWQRRKITALKYRFLDVPDGGLRYTSKGGSECLVFGLGMAGEHYGTLWLCEGELNCIAVWQARKVYGGRCRVNWDALSFGSEGSALSPLIVSRAREYQQVILWCDRPEVAARAAREIPGAYALRSPEYGGVKFDAAELTRRGQLGEFLEMVDQRVDSDPACVERARSLIEGPGGL